MSYLNTIKQGAINAWYSHQILPSIAGAQAILESGSGTSSLSRPPHNNHFGIKASADWTGRTVSLPTREWLNGGWVSITASFRSYNTVTESFQDYAAFFTNTPWREENYKHVVGERDYKKAAWALQNAGYATDPQYANKLITRIENNNLQEWDRIALAGGTGEGSKPPTSSAVITPRSKTVGADLTNTGRNYVRSLSVTIIGDSLGVGTRPYLEQILTNGNYNVAGSRQLVGGNSPDGLTALRNMKAAGTLRNIVVIILGTNLGVQRSQLDTVMEIVENRKVLFVDTASEVNHRASVTAAYLAISKSNPNAFHVDWANHAQPMMADWYYDDGANGEYIHMTPEGYKKHAEYIAEAIHEVSTGNFTQRSASNPLKLYHDIKDVVLTEDGVMTYTVYDMEGTASQITEQTELRGLYSPLGDDAIYNPEAQGRWGVDDGLITSQWIESIYEDSSTTDGKELMIAGARELLERAEPSAQYRVSLMDIHPDISIGDTGIFIDHEFNPPLYIQARVLELTTSYTDPSLNSVVIGNVIELYPEDKSDIHDLRSELQDIRSELKRELLENERVEVRMTQSSELMVDSKKLRAELSVNVFRGTEDVTSQFTDFRWERASSNAEADETFNETLKLETTNSIVVMEEDIVGSESIFLVRVYNNAGIVVGAASTIVTLIKEGNKNTISAGLEEPSNPSIGDFWLTPNPDGTERTRYWDGTDWIETIGSSEYGTTRNTVIQIEADMGGHFVFGDGLTIGKAGSHHKLELKDESVELIYGTSSMGKWTGNLFEAPNIKTTGTIELPNHIIESVGGVTVFRPK